MRTSLSLCSAALAVGVALASCGGAPDPAAAAAPVATTPPATGRVAAPSGPTLYVAPGGSDHAAGTAAAPLRTPQAALDRLPASGGSVVLAAGTYHRDRIVIAGRHGITVRAAGPTMPVLDATGLTPPDGDSGVVDIHDGSDITISGLAITGYRTTSEDKVPAGILVTGGGAGVTISGDHVYRLGNDNPTEGSFDTNAHGIAVYGTEAATPISGLRITGDEVDHLVLGASESVVVNGDVTGWAITGNHIHDDDNIGIDAIGYEPTITGSARYTDADRARDGVVSGNTVTAISADGNPSYLQDGSYCHCADGIYVDGGTAITISGNTLRGDDIGIEVAAEDPKGKADHISVTGNVISGSAFVGLSIGGYDAHRGQAFAVSVTGNTLRGDDTLDDGSPEILLQYKVHDTQLTGNSVTSTNADDPELVQRVPAAGGAALDAGVTLDRNRYAVPGDPGDAGFSWFAKAVTGLPDWQQLSGQDLHSTLVTASP